MCVVCGCGQERGETSLKSNTPDGTSPRIDKQTGDMHFGASAARVSVPGMSEIRTLKLEKDVLSENSRLAQLNRAHFAAHGVTAYDLVSSPGSGKTSLLCKTIAQLVSRRPSLPVAVIEGDQQTSLDADRIRQTGASAIQVNTGRGCHLDALMVGKAFEQLGLHSASHEYRESPESLNTIGPPSALLLIENVGNLVCPAMWDLGEAAKVVILSVTEGADKPLKYPDMFSAATLMLINKIDLLPYVDFNVEQCIESARRVNPDIQVLSVSASSGEGINDWIDWLLQHRG